MQMGLMKWPLGIFPLFLLYFYFFKALEISRTSEIFASVPR